MKIPISEIKKIAVFRALHLGDLLCSMPAIGILRRTYPEAWISLIGLSNSQSIVKRFHTYIDELIVFPGYPGLPEQDFNPSSIEIFIQKMQRRKFDLLLQMQGKGTIVNTLCTQFHPVHLAGFYPDNERVESPLFMPYPNYGHESQRHLMLLNHLGLSTTNGEMEFPLTDKDEDDFLKLPFQPFGVPYVCIHPGSRKLARQWPTSCFSRIGDYVSGKGFNVVLTGTEEELEITKRVAEQMHFRTYNLAGETSLGSLALLLKNSTGLISNCTGISHISAALKVPSVIISMDGEPLRWGPIHKALHYTHDWLEKPDFEMIVNAVKLMLIPPSMIP